ncbi:hypothetical protein AVEN_163950-1 [Araneus ventricosus]|uniref:Uncharacterized protein n=1 Tax=Araneus ventricosus TaxID=182803 RepID=A0A4Y2GYE0_ARAVE|nr:hypothetical protein AVEN_163950-1 [Araneus ventricosus]
MTLPQCLLVLAKKNGVAFTPWVALTGDYTPDVHHPLLPETPSCRVEATNKSKGVHIEQIGKNYAHTTMKKLDISFLLRWIVSSKAALISRRCCNGVNGEE